jgi:hypothetical protein
MTPTPRLLQSSPSILDSKWLPGLAILLLAAGLCAACGLSSLLWMKATLYPGVTLTATRGATLTTQGGLQSGMAVAAVRNVFSTGAASMADISAWYRSRGWEPRFRANTSEGTTYINSHSVLLGPARVEWQTRIIVLYDLSPPRMLVNHYFTIAW